MYNTVIYHYISLYIIIYIYPSGAGACQSLIGGSYALGLVQGLFRVGLGLMLVC